MSKAKKLKAAADRIKETPVVIKKYNSHVAWWYMQQRGPKVLELAAQDILDTTRDVSEDFFERFPTGAIIP
jgi:hypothetical protein